VQTTTATAPIAKAPTAKATTTTVTEATAPAETKEINDVGPGNLRIAALKLGAKRQSTDSVNDEHELNIKHSRT
jgi:hypothetical protein